MEWCGSWKSNSGKGPARQARAILNHAQLRMWQLSNRGTGKRPLSSSLVALITESPGSQTRFQAGRPKAPRQPGCRSDCRKAHSKSATSRPSCGTRLKLEIPSFFMKHTLTQRIPETVCVLFALICCGMSSGVAGEPLRLSIWPDEAPLGGGKSEKVKVPITVHLPEPGRATGASLVICPGGGYGGRVVEGEGHGIARWLNAHGIAGVVLEYRLPAGNYHRPLLDAQRAIRTVRAHAAEWKLDPHRIGIIGFSAGGHLASTAGTHFDAGDRKSSDPVAQQSCRPDFMVLVYPVITMGAKTHGGSRRNFLGPAPTAELVELFSNEKQVTDRPRRRS